MGTSASLISHHRDRVTEDDTVGVNFLSLSLISAAGDNGELFLSCLLCLLLGGLFFLFFILLCITVSVYNLHVVVCFIYSDISHKCSDFFGVVCAFVHNYVCAEQLKKKNIKNHFCRNCSYSLVVTE